MIDRRERRERNFITINIQSNLRCSETSGEVDVKLKKDLIDKIKKVVDESEGEFTSVEEYIEFVLTELLKEEEEEIYTPEEEEEIKKRLRALGYIE